MTSETAIAKQKGWATDVEGDGTGCKSSVEAINHKSYLLPSEGGVQWISGRNQRLEIFDLMGHVVFSTDSLEGDVVFVPLASGAYVARYDHENHKLLID